MNETTELKLQQALNSKGAIKNAIEAKGVTVGDAPFDQYASKINAIPTPIDAPDNDVMFFDYDGTCVASYTIEEAKALTSLPVAPAHDGLIFQEWNWSLQDIITYNRRFANIGANYITSDGKTHIFVKMAAGEELSFTIKAGYNITVNVDYGDGEVAPLGTRNGSRVYTHTYASAGIYEILLSTRKDYNNDGGDWFFINTLPLPDNIYKIHMGNYMMICCAFYKGIISVPTGSFSNDNTTSVLSAKQLNIPRGNHDLTKTNLFYAAEGEISFPKQVNSAFSGTRFMYYGVIQRAVMPDVIDKSASHVNNYTFSGMVATKKMSFPDLDFDYLANGNYFGSMLHVEEFDIVNGWVPDYSILMSSFACWKKENIVDFFTKLGSTSSTITLTLGNTLLNKLTADEKAIATGKGYTLA